MDNSFEIAWHELEIQPRDILTAIGYRGDVVPEKIAHAVEQLWLEYRSLIQPKVAVRVLPARLLGERLICDCAQFAIGNKIATQVASLDSIALFVCTVDDKLEQESARLTELGELMHGYVLDVIGSLAAERLAELLQNMVEQRLMQEGLTISTRFSPGYCNWPVGEQRQLFQLLGGQPCGVVLSNSAMMKPLKSVSGFIAIGAKMRKGYACSNCDVREKCLYRNSRMDKKSLGGRG